MNRLSKATAILLLGAGMTLFAAEATTQTQTTATTSQPSVERTSGNGAASGAESDAQTQTAQKDDGRVKALEAQIERIRHANPEARRELMNQFKEELATMNRQDRMEAVAHLQAQMQKLNAEQAMAHASEHADQGMGQMAAQMGQHAGTQGAEAGMNAGAMGADMGARAGRQGAQQGAARGFSAAQMGGAIAVSSHRTPGQENAASSSHAASGGMAFMPRH